MCDHVKILLVDLNDKYNLDHNLNVRNNQSKLETIKQSNIKARSEHCKFNTEFVPAEGLGVKNAK